MQTSYRVLVVKYANAAVLAGVATERGDLVAANRQHNIIADIYAQLRCEGSNAQRELLPLLEHSDPHVRQWAAAHALEFSPEDGERVLRELVENATGFTRVDAANTLNAWRTKELRFP